MAVYVSIDDFLREDGSLSIPKEFVPFVVFKIPEQIECEHCGEKFYQTDKRQRFCPTVETNGRSKCSNRYDAMVRRIIEWHYKYGLSLEEIQKKLKKPRSRSIKEIQSILDNYKGKVSK